MTIEEMIMKYIKDHPHHNFEEVRDLLQKKRKKL